MRRKIFWLRRRRGGGSSRDRGRRRGRGGPEEAVLEVEGAIRGKSRERDEERTRIRFETSVETKMSFELGVFGKGFSTALHVADERLWLEMELHVTREVLSGVEL